MTFIVRRCAPFLLVIAALVLRAPAWAQSTLGAITGTVKDPSGAVLQDVTVRARNVATNLEAPALTDSHGSFSISNIPGGTYQIEFTKAGFEKERHECLKA